MMKEKASFSRHDKENAKGPRAVGLIICIILSAALVLIRLFAPELTRTLKRTVLPEIERDIDYEEAVASFGDLLGLAHSKGEEASIEDAQYASAVIPQSGSADLRSEQLSIEAMQLGTYKAVLRFEQNASAVQTFLPGELPFETCRPLSGGEELLAFAGGVVECTAESVSLGDYVILSHGNGYETLYAHLDEIAVSQGETVSCGAVVGKAEDADNFHFELMKDGKTVDAGLLL